ncbi:YggS family pyridoxal phosphate-dependent enzyme [Pelagibacteraceae bacterium]|nr:YggS family pyridoxal phosphate-dependent enzyme [Pelagibacteraceae bacterium]
MMFNINKYEEIRDFLKKNAKISEIIAISKNHPKEYVLEAISHGVKIFGENRVLEAKNKFMDIKNNHPGIELHLTGPLQSNKVKMAVDIFDVFHTLDREKIAKEFSKFSDRLKNKKIFIQVNTGDEIAKSGVSISDLKEFKNYCVRDLSLNIVGLMCIPPINDPPEVHFRLLSDLANKNNLNELSIGMSGDYKKAIDFNPSYIRLGTILFGNRDEKKN